jgi:hypothetical protein
MEWHANDADPCGSADWRGSFWCVRWFIRGSLFQCGIPESKGVALFYKNNLNQKNRMVSNRTEASQPCNYHKKSA